MTVIKTTDAALQPARPIAIIAAVAVFLVIVALAVPMHASLWKDDTLGRDIQSIYEMSRELNQGINPYERILPGRRDDEKYAIYLPLFFIFGALAERLGAQEFDSWISVWRVTSLVVNIGIGALLYGALVRRDLPIVAVFTALYWFFNRWTLYITTNGQIDLPAVFFMLAAALVFRRNHWAAFVLLGLSLALKHISIFVVPLFLIWVWQAHTQGKIRHTVIAAIAIAAVPLLISLPFAIWNGEAFAMSMRYSLEREAENHFRVASLDELLTIADPAFTGLAARLPLFGMLGLVYLGALRRQIPMFFSLLLTITVFVDFNSVVFRQHLVWLAPLIPLALCDVADAVRGKLKIED